MKDFFEDLGRKITKTAENVGKKTDEVVEVQKIKSQIRTLEKTNERDFLDLGKMLYERYKNGEVVDGDCAEICEEMSKREEAIAQLEDQVADAKGMVICATCESRIAKGMAFCPNCGAKIEEPEETVEESEETVEEPEETVEKTEAGE
ncbi:MAG: zinc ribbon domain-containing protein [Lachnospiraceae bacterium]|nr:zinc ribbon domain-containing protein [Lachnospiraceae bacterium]